MSYISFIFFVFLVILMAVNFALPKDKRWIALLLASLLFYVWAEPIALPIMVALTFAAWFAGLKMEKIYNTGIDESATVQEKRKHMAAKRPESRVVLKAALVLLIFALAFFKCVRKVPIDICRSMIIPMGISYFTFSVIGYIVDIYYGKIKAEKNFFKFLLFVSYFPKILEGPISKYQKMGDLFEGHDFDYDRVCKGIQLMAWGLAKKLILVARVLPAINRTFNNVGEFSGSTLLVMSILLAIESYADFAGCMDIGRGASQIFGIELDLNFDHPFFSRSGAEFWRRWHMSLGVFMKDYVYMPIVSSPWLAKMMQFARKKISPRAGKLVMQIVPTLVVWVLVGIWHGTGRTYVVWGVYWGVIISVSTVLEPAFAKFHEKTHISADAAWWKGFQIFRTMVFFIIGRLITVPNSLTETVRVIKRTFFDFNAGEFMTEMVKLGFTFDVVIVVVVFCIIHLVVSILEEYKGWVLRDKIAAMPLPVRWAVYALMFYAVFLLGVYGAGYEVNTFGYANF